MFSITETITSTHEYESAVNTAKGIITFGDRDHDVVITDSNTGELYFIYKSGNVEYIQGDFAKALVQYW